jgi:hypothetical protein
MNRTELRKNIGKTFQFLPHPRHDSATGSYESDKNKWLLRRETQDKKGFEFLNLLGDYSPLVLDSPKINKFDDPDILILRGQVIFDGSTVRYEPFTPKPASVSTTTVNLRISVEGSDENNVLMMTSPPFEPVRFVIENIGEQTVRDYRNTVLIPTAFTRTSSASYLGNLKHCDDVEIDKHPYSVFSNFILQPIYKRERVRIGSLSLKANYGEYKFFWQIRCDDGTFPSEDTYGSVHIHVVPLSDLIMLASEHVDKS